MNIPNKWTEREESILLELLSHNLSLSTISNDFKGLSKLDPLISPRSTEAIARKLRRINHRTLKPEPIEIPKTNPWDSLKAYREKHCDPSSFSSVGLVKKATKKILSFSDIHFPLAREDFLKEAIAQHRDADILVLNGDILDGHAASRFEKDKDIAAIEEYITAFDFIEYCSTVFPKVIIVSGNHDVRTSKLLKKAPVNQQALTVFETDLLARIANGERLNKSGHLIEKLKFDNVYYSKHENWWIKIGKTIFAHPQNRGGGKPGTTVEQWSRKFLERMHGTFDSLVIGHTHKLYKGIVSGLLLIEQGAMADYMSYSWEPREVVYGNAMNGYAVIYQDKEGNTDFNRSNFVYCGQLLPTNKPNFEELDND